MENFQQSIGSDQSLTIDEIEIFFEPHEFVKQFITGESSDSFLNENNMIQKAIDSADDQLHFHGKLKTFAQGQSFDANDVQIVDEMDDNGWARFINGRTKDRKWHRWYGQTSYGRWNVVVYKLENQQKENNTIEVTNQVRKAILAEVGPINIALGDHQKIVKLGTKAVSECIDLFRNPVVEGGTVNQAVLTLALCQFSKDGDPNAKQFLEELASGRVPVDPQSFGDSAIELAKDHLREHNFK